MCKASNLVLALAATTLCLSACSQKSDEAAPSRSAAEAQDSAASGSLSHSDEAPGFDTAAAPGVAFAYRYAFALPDEAISDVQSDHAASCEKLGAARCRITGMNYDKSNSGAVRARLDFLLAPDLAHRFGKEALAVVEKADGRLEDANVTGENAGGAIELSQQNSAALDGELKRIEARLMAKGLSAEERQALAEQAGSIREQLRGQASTRMAAEKSIATTPMSFAYASEGMFSANGDPFGRAAETSWGSLTAMLSFVLTLFGLIAPWALLVGLVWLAVRGIRSRSVAANLKE